jgi:hypothetical protein
MLEIDSGARILQLIKESYDLVRADVLKIMAIVGIDHTPANDHLPPL